MTSTRRNFSSLGVAIARAAGVFCALGSSTAFAQSANLDVESFGSAIGAAVSESDFAGVVAVSQGRRTVFQRAYCLRDIVNNLPNQLDTRFAIGSITKVVTATLIEILYDHGKIELDESIGTYLPQLAEARPDLAKALNVRHLLTHSSGLGQYQGAEYLGVVRRLGRF